LVIDFFFCHVKFSKPVKNEHWKFDTGFGGKKVNKKEEIMGALHLNEKNFDQEVLKSNLPVLVDFWAPWCGPCRAIAPIIEELSTELQGKMKVAKVDVDEAQDLAAQFEVSSIPTLLIFKNGKVVEEMLGAMPKSQLLAKIQPHL
jgi:thioredoxin 1